MHAETRGRVLADTVAGLQRRYGNAAVHRGPEPDGGEAGGWATGIPALDIRLAPGGLPRGRVTLLQAARRGRAAGSPCSRRWRPGPATRARWCTSTSPPASTPASSPTSAPTSAAASPSSPAGALARGAGDGPRPGGGRFALGGGGARPRAPPRAEIEQALNGLVEAVHRRRAVCVVAAPSPAAAPLAYASSLTLSCLPAGWQESHGDVTGLRVALEVSKSRLVRTRCHRHPPAPLPPPVRHRGGGGLPRGDDAGADGEAAELTVVHLSA